MPDGSYTGDVRPGGPVAVRTLDEVTVRKVSVGPMDNDAYLLTCHATGSQLLVDAAADPAALLTLVREGDPEGGLDLVVTTHRHADHLGALADVLAATGAQHAAGAPDAEAVARAAGAAAPRPLRHGDRLAVGALTLDVVALRGHTPGAIALAYREPDDATVPGAVAGRTHLFTGDSLFPGGPGRTTTPESFTSLMDDLVTRVFDRFRDDTWVYPGHGRDTTLGAERPHLDQWRARGW